jgi:hypothetical protein
MNRARAVAAFSIAVSIAHSIALSIAPWTALTGPRAARC